MWCIWTDRRDRSGRTRRVAVTILALLTALVVHAGVGRAQARPAATGPQSLFLPLVSGAQPPTGPILDITLNTDPAAVEAELLAESSRLLPEPPPLNAAPGTIPPTNDFDGDGVANGADNCPLQPNPAVNGTQPARCGQALPDLVDRQVFLAGRIFTPTAGLDPALARTQVQPRVHVLLHLKPTPQGIVLPQRVRGLMESEGIFFLSYVPHNSFFVSLPRDEALLRRLVRSAAVQGISALRPSDKVAPSLRVQGAALGRNANGTLTVAVDFWPDVPRSAIDAALTQAGLAFVYQDEHTYHITLPNWAALRRLAVQDSVAWIEDLPEPPTSFTRNAQALINGLTVNNSLGYRGNGIVVAMTELEPVEPLDHPDMNGRIIAGNNPIFGGDQDAIDHAQKVAAILIADETNFPTNVGLLPEANLVTFGTAGLTIRAQHFAVNEEARNDYGALLSNNSWGPVNCNKLGEYRKRGKYFDRAVYDVGIVVVRAVGNTRGPDGLLADEGCQTDLASLPHPVAKNDIAVGNWDIFNSRISETSAAGPAADGRLKPDLVAPGDGIDTIGYNETTQRSFPEVSGGTSMAAPVVSGVIGWLAEEFISQGQTIESIPPARFKAILIHTAKDVGPTGPDFVHGYGLIQADRALRIADEWNLWGHEATLTESSPRVEIPFAITSPMVLYKATLVWDDEEGTESATLALKNDLDLTLVSPSGVIYRPYDLAISNPTALTGSAPCTRRACQDRLNNVEMVRAGAANGDFLETGNWLAVVEIHRLVAEEQAFSLVLTPPCPVVIDDYAVSADAQVVLPADLTCTPHPLEPSGIIIAADGVTLNCDNHAVRGGAAGINNFDGSYVGIRVLGNRTTVRNCSIHRFDVGIKTGWEPGDGSGDAPMTVPITGARILNNVVAEVGSAAIELLGDDHTVQNNNIANLLVVDGKGVVMRGNNLTVHDNVFGLARTTGRNETIGIIARPNTEFGDITANEFSGDWWMGIRLRSVRADQPVKNYLVDGNTFEGILTIPIELSGDVRTTGVTNNDVQAYGSGYPGIHLTAADDFFPQGNIVGTNDVLGFANSSQLGIVLSGTLNSNILANTLSTVSVGVADTNGRNTQIGDNRINPTPPLNNFVTPTGIRTTGAVTIVVISGNTVNFSSVGIEVKDPVGKATVAGNGVDARSVGIRVSGAAAPVVSGNNVSPDGAGIVVLASPTAEVRGNTIANLAAAQAFSGIGVTASHNAIVSGNDVDLPEVGISIAATEGISVSGNTVDNPGTAAIEVTDDSGAQVGGNVVTNNGVVGIHYRSGKDAVVEANTVNSIVGGVGIRLGVNAAGCPVNVDKIVVQNNTLSGSATDIDVECDAPAPTLINNN